MDIEKIERAIQTLKSRSKHVASMNLDAQLAYKLAIDALEDSKKQIPKKPIGNAMRYCPHCEKVFVNSNNDYCHRCGGAIEQE